MNEKMELFRSPKESPETPAVVTREQQQQWIRELVAAPTERGSSREKPVPAEIVLDAFENKNNALENLLAKHESLRFSYKKAVFNEKANQFLNYYETTNEDDTIQYFYTAYKHTRNEREAQINLAGIIGEATAERFMEKSLKCESNRAHPMLDALGIDYEMKQKEGNQNEYAVSVKTGLDPNSESPSMHIVNEDFLTNIPEQYTVGPNEISKTMRDFKNIVAEVNRRTGRKMIPLLMVMPSLRKTIDQRNQLSLLPEKELLQSWETVPIPNEIYQPMPKTKYKKRITREFNITT